MQATFKRAPTGDRGPPGAATITVDILTNEQLGPKMSKLPNGSLLCRDVPIARVGWMMYGPGETPVKVGDMGVAYVERTEDDLFNPETIGSFMASTVTDEHPGDASGVIPANWKQLAKGFATTNVRRGTGADSDVLLADLVITDAALIESVLRGKREVSCGYEADYHQTAPGVGRQTNILGNHIALVEKGRCGPRCAIGDRALTTPATPEGRTMTQRTPLKNARKTLDPDAVELARAKVADAQAELDALEEEEATDTGVHVHIHGGPSEPAVKAKTEDKRLDTLEATVTQLATSVAAIAEKLGTAPAKDAATIAAEAQADAAAALAKAKQTPQDDPDKDPTTGKTHDSAALATGFQKVLAQAEVLVPGFRMPTFDAAAKRSVTVDAMCGARRRCLELAYATVDGKTLIDGIAGTDNVDLDKMDCAAAAILFGAAATTKAAMNNRSATGDSGKLPKDKDEPTTSKTPTFAELNKANAEFWAKNQPQPA